jgi:type IV secretory pathway VirB2 component (pilin)
MSRLEKFLFGHPINRRRRSTSALITAALLALLVFLPMRALAQGSPFDTGFNAVQSLFTGTIAKVASLVAIVIGGNGFAHGEPGATKALAGVAAGTGIAVLAVKLDELNKRTKEAVDFLVAALESGHSEVLTAYLGAMAKFHSYSFGNIMLIARQKPDATNVAGLRTWNSLGRFVKRGEKGIFILAPMIGKKRQEETAAGEEDKKSIGEARLYGFRAVYVFDVSQTEGKDLPALTEVNGEVRGYRERLLKFVESQSVELSFSERIAPAKGLSHGGKITLLPGMKPAEEFSTLVHEIAHEMLHRGKRRTLTTKQVRETEAEAVAFVVCQSVGLQNGTASQDYIQLWHGDANLLRESLEAVQQTAAVILRGIAPEPSALAAGA